MRPYLASFHPLHDPSHVPRSHERMAIHSNRDVQMTRTCSPYPDLITGDETQELGAGLRSTERHRKLERERAPDD